MGGSGKEGQLCGQCHVRGGTFCHTAADKGVETTCTAPSWLPVHTSSDRPFVHLIQHHTCTVQTNQQKLLNSSPA